MEEKIFKVKQGYIVREIAGEFLAVPIDSSSGAHIIILNPVSKFLWEQLGEEKTFKQLLESILSNYENVSEEEAAKDLNEFLEQLEENKFLV